MPNPFDLQKEIICWGKPDLALAKFAAVDNLQT